MTTRAVWHNPNSGWRVRAGAASHIGNYREQNEDHVYLDPDQPFALVLDGMGGHEAGQQASSTGAEVIAGVLRAGLGAGEAPLALIERALRAGNEALLVLSESSVEFRNCGTTIVFAFLSGGTVWVSWLGDSLAFRISGEFINQLTWAHDLRRAMLNAGTISEAEIKDYRGGHQLWRYLGTREAQPPFDVVSLVPHPGDTLVLTTDGISNVVSEGELLTVSRAQPNPQHCAEELTNCALDNNSRDNCTCAVLTFDWVGSDPPPEPLQQVWEVGGPELPRLIQRQPVARKWWQFWK